MGKKVKRSEIRAIIDASFDKDLEAVEMIRSRFIDLIDMCIEKDVEPETLLHELTVIRHFSETLLMNKIAGTDDLSKLGKKKRKEFVKTCEVIDQKGAETFLSLNAEGLSRSNHKKASDQAVPNESQPYNPRNERPWYIQ
ncbi:MAG: hypothetical protein HPY73_09025 [Methanomassiliicoccales archaeon]|nr:MAG: hypothetical protein HPY73_09025 [Methanomassiliicoccales archaeon]